MDRNREDTIRFIPFIGDSGDLVTNDNHKIFQWKSDNCLILFSVTRKGDACSCHFSSDKRGLRYIKQAIEEWMDFVFFLYDWCTMVLAIIKKPSVERLVKKCSFEHLATVENMQIYVRPKWVA